MHEEWVGEWQGYWWIRCLHCFILLPSCPWCSQSFRLAGRVHRGESGSAARDTKTLCFGHWSRSWRVQWGSWPVRWFPCEVPGTQSWCLPLASWAASGVHSAACAVSPGISWNGRWWPEWRWVYLDVVDLLFDGCGEAQLRVGFARKGHHQIVEVGSRTHK